MSVKSKSLSPFALSLWTRRTAIANGFTFSGTMGQKEREGAFVLLELGKRGKRRINIIITPPWP
jgi:hypothetical protein